jgi:hypothetical protein
MHLLQRHRDILHDYTQEFHKTKVPATLPGFLSSSKPSACLRVWCGCACTCSYVRCLECVRNGWVG